MKVANLWHHHWWYCFLGLLYISCILPLTNSVVRFDIITECLRRAFFSLQWWRWWYPWMGIHLICWLPLIDGISPMVAWIITDHQIDYDGRHRAIAEIQMLAYQTSLGENFQLDIFCHCDMSKLHCPLNVTICHWKFLKCQSGGEFSHYFQLEILARQEDVVLRGCQCHTCLKLFQLFWKREAQPPFPQKFPQSDEDPVNPASRVHISRWKTKWVKWMECWEKVLEMQPSSQHKVKFLQTKSRQWH